MTIADSIISDNSATSVVNYWFVTILNSILSGNSAGPGYAGGGKGSGTFKTPGSVTVLNSDNQGNSAPLAVASITAAMLSFPNTILNGGASGDNNGGTVTSHGYNISSDNGGGFLTGTGDQIKTDPLLGPLQDHGGPTLTHLPGLDSPAIDAGDQNFARPP